MTRFTGTLDELAVIHTDIYSDRLALAPSLSHALIPVPCVSISTEPPSIIPLQKDRIHAVLR